MPNVAMLSVVMLNVVPPQERPAWDKHSSLSGPSVSYKENQVG